MTAREQVFKTLRMQMVLIVIKVGVVYAGLTSPPVVDCPDHLKLDEMYAAFSQSGLGSASDLRRSPYSTCTTMWLGQRARMSSSTNRSLTEEAMRAFLKFRV